MSSPDHAYLFSGTNEEVEMIVEERPRMDTYDLGFTEGFQPCEKVLSVLIIPKNGNPLDPSAHHMMQSPWCIQSRLSWHVSQFTPFLPHVKHYFSLHQRPHMYTNVDSGILING